MMCNFSWDVRAGSAAPYPNCVRVSYVSSCKSPLRFNGAASHIWHPTFPCTKKDPHISESLYLCYESTNYSLIAVTTPEPTVRPPSRIAKRRPSSIAISVISVTSISTLSPGIHISTPAGSEIVPVTSVVLK